MNIRLAKKSDFSAYVQLKRKEAIELYKKNGFTTSHYKMSKKIR